MLLSVERAFRVNEIQRIKSLQSEHASMAFNYLQSVVRAEAAVNTSVSET